MGLSRVADRIWTCASEGQCIGKGPTNPWSDQTAPLGFCAPHERFKFEDYTARGRLYLSRLLHQGKIEPTAKNLLKVAYTCNTCGICDEVCTLRPVEAFRALREELVERGVAPPETNQQVIRNVDSRNNPFGALPDARSRWAERLDLSATGDTLYFAGCYASFRQPDTARATVKVLKSAGVDVAYLGRNEWCCGLPASWNGERALAKEKMKHNLEVIKDSGASTVAFSCAECYRTFKTDYKEMFGELPFRVVHVAELFSKLVEQDRIKFGEVKQRVTYHDPCFLGRHSKVYDQPRKIISSVPGVKLVEMEHNGQWAFCCGSGAGVVQTAYPDFATWTATNRLAEATKAADIVVTACPRCVENLTDAARRSAIEIGVQDLPVFVANAARTLH